MVPLQHRKRAARGWRDITIAALDERLNPPAAHLR